MDTGFEQEYLAELTETKEKPVFHFATVGGVYADGVSLIFDGQTSASQKHYKRNRTISTIKVGDRVKIFPDSGTYVVEYVIGVEDYIWEEYEINGSYTSRTNSNPSAVFYSGSTKTYYASNYSFNSKTGIYTLTSPLSIVGDGNTAGNAGVFSNKYWMTDTQSAASVNYGIQYYLSDQVLPASNRYSTGSSSRGQATGRVLFSDDPNAYPANGIQGDYWYVLQT